MLDLMLENALGFPVCLMNNPHVQFLIQMDGGLICITQAFWYYFVVIIPSPFGYVYGNFTCVWNIVQNVVVCLETSILLVRIRI